MLMKARSFSIQPVSDNPGYSSDIAFVTMETVSRDDLPDRMLVKVPPTHPGALELVPMISVTGIGRLQESSPQPCILEYEHRSPHLQYSTRR